MTRKFSNICITIFNTQDSYNWDLSKIQYFIYQHERAATTNRDHLQGYVEFYGRHSMNKIKRIFNDSTMHIEERKGTQKQAIDYCKKDDTRIPYTGFVEHGVRKEQGKRNDIGRVVADIRNGVPLFDLVNEHGESFVKYHKGFDYIYNVYLREQSKTLRDISVHLLWGRAGAGKSKYVYDNTNINDSYRLRVSRESWFCGYRGEKTLIIEEFNGQIPFEFFLQILDKYPLQLPIKGSHSYALWTKVFITSNVEPMFWYHGLTPDQLEALTRRLTIVQEVAR